MNEPNTTMETLAATLPPTPGQGSTTLEKIRPDLNLEKWSIWQPAKSKVKPRERTIRREIELANGDKVSAEVEVGFTNKGVLTTEDQKTFYALIQLWEQKGRPTEQTYYSLRTLAKALRKRWGTNVIDATSKSLMRLRITPIIWKNSYHNSEEKVAIEILDPFSILSDLKVIRRTENGHVTREEGYFKFNDFILKNIFNNYTKPVLLDVVLSFKSEIAQLLYTHLDLMLARRNVYERKTRELFDDLGLDSKEYRKTSSRIRVLTNALQELTGARLSTGFITSAKLEKTADGKDYKIIITKGVTQPRTAIAEHTPDPTPVAEPTEATTPLTDQAHALVNRFYQLFQNTTQAFPSSKAISQAVALIAQHGIELARFIVDFAHREAPKTNFKPQTFGGILQYVPRAVAEHTNENARRKAQQAKTDCTLCDRNGYATFTNEQGSGAVVQCPHNLDTIHTIEAARNWRHVPC